MKNLFLQLAAITEPRFIVIGEGWINFQLVDANEGDFILNKFPLIHHDNTGWGDFVLIKEGEEIGKGHLCQDERNYSLTFCTSNQQ